MVAVCLGCGFDGVAVMSKVQGWPKVPIMRSYPVLYCAVTEGLYQEARRQAVSEECCNGVLIQDPWTHNTQFMCITYEVLGEGGGG